MARANSTNLTIAGSGFSEVSRNSGATINSASRTVLNFIEGSNITLTITDDSGGDEVDITIASSGGGGGGGIAGIQTKTANYTVLTGDENNLFLLDASSSAVTITLPAAATAGTDFVVYFKATDITNTITIDGNSTETIDGATTQTLDFLYESITIVCDGTEWWII